MNDYWLKLTQLNRDVEKETHKMKADSILTNKETQLALKELEK